MFLFLLYVNLVFRVLLIAGPSSQGSFYLFAHFLADDGECFDDDLDVGRCE